MSLASNGITHQSSKSDLMECLESVAPKSESVPDVDGKIVDGAALSTYWIQRNHKSLSKHSMTMHSSCSCQRMLQDVVRIYIVWDTYMEDSLKAQTRMNRGSGNHLRVFNSTNIPVDWKSFIRCDAHKDSLFHLPADAIREFYPPQRKQVISTKLWPECCILCHSRPLISVLHSRRSGHMVPVPCLPFFHHGFSKLMIHAT